MAIFKIEEEKKTPSILRLNVDTSTGPTALLKNEYLKDQAEVLYPLVSNTPKEEVKSFLEAGVVGPIESKAQAITTEKQTNKMLDVIEMSRLDQKTPEQAIAELEELRETNPMLKAFVPKEVLHALKQSDSPVAQRAAQGRLANVLIASTILNNKMSESNEESFWANFDFVDMLASDLPIVSSINVERRKELSDRFLQLLDSNEDPGIIQKEMQAIVDEAADMGFFTNSNRFYMNDFLMLTMDQGKGGELALQQGLAGLDAIAFLAGLGDAGKLVAMTRESVEETAEVLTKGVIKDNPAGGVDPATWKESILTPEATTIRSPTVSAAVKDVELALQAREEAIAVRLASGSAIDDETFEPFVAVLKEQAKARAEKAGNLRTIDVTVDKDPFDNITMAEFYGTTKGRAFTSQVAAQKYADQILGEIVPVGSKIVPEPPVPSDMVRFYHHGGIGGTNTYSTNKAYSSQYANGSDELYYFDVPKTDDAVESMAINNWQTSITTASLDPNKYGGLKRVGKVSEGGFMVKKTSNVPTGWYSQGATPEAIAKDLSLYPALREDELGNGVWAHIGSGLAQTDWTNNAILKQGEAARALALESIEVDVGAKLKAVGRDGRTAVEKVFKELRDGSLANLRQAPTTAEFDDYFFKINGRKATEDELDLYRLQQEWNDTDWFMSADMHFKREVNRGVEILVPQDGMEVPAIKSSREANAGREVWDADAGKYVAIESLSGDREIYRLVEATEFGGQMTDLVASATPRTRALKHTDVMGYNVGGSRLYANNKTNFMIKQDTTVDLAGGVTRQGTPRTILVAKTEKEANKAVAEINEVLTELHKIANPKAFDNADDYIRVIQSKNGDVNLNELIARNSAWNTDVHSVMDLVEFATENKFDLRELVDAVSDGQQLVKGDSMIGDITFKDVAIAPGPLKYGDFRNDKVLMGYGGQRLPTVAPFEAMQRSVMSAMARQTEVAYESRAILRLYKTALEENLLSKQNIAAIRNMSLRQKARNMEIATGTEFGKKLELERKKILTRLEKQRVLDVAYHNMKDRWSNILYDKGFKKISEKMDALSADPVSGTRGIVFDTFFWGAVDQAWVQASQLFAIMAMSNKTRGIEAAALAPFFRGTVANGHAAVEEAMSKLMGKAVSVDPKHMKDMIDVFKTSGRAAVQASVADLGEDAGGKIALRTVREKGRFFYNEGELISRISAHISASLDYIAKYGPKADLKSQHAKRWVMHESDKLTHAMTSTSRHPIEQFPMMQFMSYALRMTEFMTAGLAGGKNVLTSTQKIKLGTMQLGFFGATAVPFGGAALAWYEYRYGTGLDETTYNAIRKGALDTLLSYITGIETEAGGRIAWGEGLTTTIQDLSNKNIVEILLGPTGTVATNAFESLNQFAGNLKYGMSRGTVDDIIDIFKTMKFANMYHNAILAWKHETYSMRNSGGVLLDDVSRGEAIAMALGIPLERVNSIWDTIGNTKLLDAYYKDVGKKISKMYYDLHREVDQNGWTSPYARQLTASIEEMYKLNPEQHRYSKYVDNTFRSMYEESMLNEAKREAERNAAGANQ
jgi:hypothetical protein